MIDQWLHKLDKLDTKYLFGIIVASSILLAAWMQHIQHGWINPDSVLYFEQARLFSLNDWQGIIAVYSWPFYGVCIGFIHQITHLNIHQSAQLLNMLFFGIATASYLNLIKLGGGNNRTLFFGMLLLFSTLYIVGDVLEMLMRDEGFWAFYLTALVFYIRYIQKEKLTDALLWQSSIILATLFRIEAILFLLFLPLFNLVTSTISIKENLKKLFHTYSISLTIGLIISITIVAIPNITITHFGRLNEVFTTNLFYEFTNKFITQSRVMSEQVLGGYLDEFAVPGLLLTFLYVIGSKVLTATGIIGTCLAIFSIKNISSTIDQNVRRVLITCAAIAIIIMVLIIIKVFILSSRYAVAFAWILLIFASFSLTWISFSKNNKTRLVFILICLILSLSFIKNILPKREGYNYMLNAVQWLKLNNKTNATVFYDDQRMIYYAGEKFKRSTDDKWNPVLNAINDESIKNYQYLALTHSNKHSERITYIKENLHDFKEVKRFNNYKSKKFIVIYHKVNIE
jgi:hypothetical protein